MLFTLTEMESNYLPGFVEMLEKERVHTEKNAYGLPELSLSKEVEKSTAHDLTLQLKKC